jgi:hypothetical protein
MFKVIKKIKEKRQAAAKEEQRLTDERIKKNKETVARLTEQMTESPCAINDMSNCTQECVHFKNGGTYALLSISGNGVFHTYSVPSCKLWKS